MTDWELKCRKCGRPVIQHVAYIDDPPENAVEGDFENSVIRGFYCLATATTDND